MSCWSSLPSPLRSSFGSVGSGLLRQDSRSTIPHASGLMMCAAQRQRHGPGLRLGSGISGSTLRAPPDQQLTRGPTAPRRPGYGPPSSLRSRPQRSSRSANVNAHHPPASDRSTARFDSALSADLHVASLAITERGECGAPRRDLLAGRWSRGQLVNQYARPRRNEPVPLVPSNRRPVR